jgi:hypothetical protein
MKDDFCRGANGQLERREKKTEQGEQLENRCFKMWHSLKDYRVDCGLTTEREELRRWLILNSYMNGL